MSINLPRLGIKANGDIEAFYESLDKMIDLACRQLLHRFAIQCKKKVRNYPFLMGQGIWLDSDKLDVDDSVAEVLRHGTLSVGFIGLAETLVALTESTTEKAPRARSWALRSSAACGGAWMRNPRRRALFHPACHARRRAVRPLRAHGQKAVRELPGITDREYYTNSFHIPVYYPIRAFDKIRLEAPYHALTNAGHISYVELDGDTSKNPEAFEAVIRCMKEAGVGYGSVNHPVDRDPVCGYTGVIDEVCPRCGRREGEAVPVEKLRELRKKYPDTPVYADPNH